MNKILDFYTFTSNSVLHSNDSNIDISNYVNYTEHNSSTHMLFFIIIAVFIGVLTRYFLKKVPIPFTALLLIIGILLGSFSRLGLFNNWGGLDVSFIEESLYDAAHIDPHLLLYIFLPILIFEAAFAMDYHTFKKTAVNSILLAVPGILIALSLSATLVVGIDFFDIGLPNWANWSLALMFGAVISATDPVAVVALLKELGASKKLGTTIEGESLLNDGTAIVIFMVFFGVLTGNADETNGIIKFIIVAFGGVGIGFIMGWFCVKWLNNIYSDAMVEITLVVGFAYLTFYLAEHFFHVSGVLALVTLGIILGGPKRSSISPKVGKFMHDFWELAGFIANCIIFLIVGLVVSQRTQFNYSDFLVLFIVYIGIHIIRAIVLFLLFPIMKNIGYGITKKESIVVWYGALRGAIGLALALMVANINPQNLANSMNISLYDAIEIKEEFLFITAGIVTLTLLINATTIKLLIEKLGLLKVSKAKKDIRYSVINYLRIAGEKKINRTKHNRFLNKADWNKVALYLPPEHKEDIIIGEDMNKNTIAELRIRLLKKEKSSYWYQFKEGMISRETVPQLIETINVLIDNNGEKSLSDRKDLEIMWDIPKWIKKLSNVRILKKIMNKQAVNNLSNSYDAAIGFVEAQDECIGLLNSIARNENIDIKVLKSLEDEINENKIMGLSFIRNLRANHIEIFKTLSTIRAIKTVLEYEEKTIKRLKSKGRIDDKEAEYFIKQVYDKRKKIQVVN